MKTKLLTISVLVIALGFVFVIFSPAYGQYMGGKLPPETMYDDETGEPIFPPSYVDFYYSNPRFEKYSVIAEQYRYDIPYMISDGIISQMVMDCSSVELVLDVEPSGKQGWMTLVLPRQLIDSKTVGDQDDYFVVLLDSKEIQRSDIASEKLRLLLVPFSNDTSQVSIIGVNYPEQMGENACNGTHDPPFSYLLSPLKQFKIGIPYSEITCVNDLMLVQKYDHSPACIKSKTIPKLIDRGWAINPISFDIQEEKEAVLIEISKNEVLSRGIGFDLPEDIFTREDLKKLEQKEIELGKITDNPDTPHDESRQAGKEITAMQDRLQNPFQTGVPYHLVKILKEKHAVFLLHYSDLRGKVWWTGSSPNDISHVHHALRIGIDPDHFTLSELEYQDKKIREYLGDEMNILYKKLGYITYDQ